MRSSSAVIALLLVWGSVGIEQPNPPLPKEFQILSRYLPPFQWRFLKKGEEGMLGGAELSPDGRWMISHAHHVQGTMESGIIEVSSLILLNAEGEVVRDLTYEHFYNAGIVGWSQTSDALFFGANRPFRRPPQEEPTTPVPPEHNDRIWKVYLSRPGFELTPFAFNESLICNSGSETFLIERPVSQPKWKGSIEREIHLKRWHNPHYDRKLTEGFGSKWSPDGSWIAFMRLRPPKILVDDVLLPMTTTWPEVWVIRPDGTGLRRLAGHPELLDLKMNRNFTPTMEISGWVGDRTLWVKLSSGFWLIDVPTGQKKQVFIDVKLISSSRDGKHLVVRLGGGRDAWYYRLDSQD